MRLKAVKEGKYGFELTADVFPPLKNKEGYFVYLDKLFFYGGSEKPLFCMSVFRGTYAVEFLADNLKVFEDAINEFESIFFGTVGSLIYISNHYVVSELPDKMCEYFFHVLLSMLKAARVDATAYATICEDGLQNPVKITLDINNNQLS